MGKEFS